MWMDVYVEQVLIRERIAAAQKHAALSHLLRRDAPRRRGLRAFLSQLLHWQAWATLRERRV